MRGVRIPADVERPDVLVGGLTARQLVILAAPAAVVWGVWVAVGSVVPLPLFAALVTAIAAGGAVVAFGQRDGLSGDRFALAALRYLRGARRQVLAPEGVPPTPSWAADPGPRLGPLAFPARGIDATGVIDLGPDGTALVCRASSLNFGLRTEAEQAALVAAFGRWANSLGGPVQIVARAARADLSATVAALEEAAGGLAHPALEAAARDHARFLAALAERADVLRRSIHVVFADPRPPDDAGVVLVHRAEEAIAALAGAGIMLTPLDGTAASAVLRAAVQPETPTVAADAASGDAVIRGVSA